MSGIHIEVKIGQIPHSNSIFIQNWPISKLKNRVLQGNTEFYNIIYHIERKGSNFLFGRVRKEYIFIGNHKCLFRIAGFLLYFWVQNESNPTAPISDKALSGSTVWKTIDRQNVRRIESRHSHFGGFWNKNTQRWVLAKWYSIKGHLSPIYNCCFIIPI